MNLNKYSALVFPVLLFGGLVLLLPARAVASQPNIILCMTDDQGWGDVSYNGNPVLKTPNLDDMARSGLRFDRFYAAHHVCSPTRGSVMTGRHPNRYRCYSWGHDLPLREVTIAEAVKTKGYATGHFGKWHLGGIANAPGSTGRGVAESVDAKPRHPGNQGFDVWCSAGNWYDLDFPTGTMFRNGEDIGAGKGDTSDIIMEEALKFIRAQAKKQQPFLAVIWFTSPHGPWKALESDKSIYAAQGEKADFYGEIATLDRAMGRLRDELRSLGIRDHTMLWFNSDNGAAGGSAGGLSGNKGNLLEGGIRVPGLLEWPERVSQPKRTDFPAGTVDFFPTLCDLLNIKMPDQPAPIDGISLMPFIDGQMKVRPKPLAFEQRDPKNDEPVFAALIDNQYKLLRLKKPLKSAKTGGEPLAAGEYLFDLSRDSAEKQNLAASQPEITARLKRQLDDWEASVTRSLHEYPDPTVIIKNQ